MEGLPPGGDTIEFESDKPRESMIQQGYAAFALEEIVTEE